MYRIDRRKPVAGLLAGLILFGVSLRGAQDARQPPVSFLRFIPGIEQMAQRRPVTGILLITAFTAAIAGTVVQNKRGYDFYDRYLESVDPIEIVQLRRDAEHCFKTRNWFIAGIFLVCAVHLVDLKIFDKKKGKIKGEIKGSGFGLGLVVTF